jgi:hypothetical protein
MAARLAGLRPSGWYARGWLIKRYKLGRREARTCPQTKGEGSPASVAHVRDARYWGASKIRALFEATHFAGLRKAGMPEE